MRANASDWLEVRLGEANETDLDHATALVETAIAANRLTAEPGPPPAEADLARRRRFH